MIRIIAVAAVVLGLAVGGISAAKHASAAMHNAVAVHARAAA